MKDLDFDELDKAVNSLMGGLAEKNDASTAKTLAINATLKDGEQPVYDNIAQAAEKIGSETITLPAETTEVLTVDTTTPVTSSPSETATASIEPVAPITPEPTPVPTPRVAVPPRSTGRFMDVMHPSSDMKGAPSTPQTSVSAPAKAAEVSRTGATIEPPAKEEVPPLAKVELAEPGTLSAAEAPADPLASTNDQPAMSPDAPERAETVPEQPPLTSPFLPDAKEKVAKRPLGSQADVVSDEVTDADFESLESPYTTDNTTDTQLPPMQMVDTELPAELHSDLVAVETNEAETAPEQPHPAENVPAAAAGATPEKVPAASVATEAPATDGAIFDTSEYHKPIAHPAKQKREWLWIVAVLVIVTVCAGGAAAFYLLSAR